MIIIVYLIGEKEDFGIFLEKEKLLIHHQIKF